MLPEVVSPGVVFLVAVLREVRLVLVPVFPAVSVGQASEVVPVLCLLTEAVSPAVFALFVVLALFVVFALFVPVLNEFRSSCKMSHCFLVRCRNLDSS